MNDIFFFYGRHIPSFPFPFSSYTFPESQLAEEEDIHTHAFFCKKATSIDGVALAVDLPLDHAEKLTVDWNYQAVCVQSKTSQENETEMMKR